MKQTVVFDFDGVIHSYASGWKGESVIPDPPVSGIREAISDIRNAGYAVAVVSSRCSSESGLAAILRYLENNDIVVDAVMKEKPPAIVYIDDRAICFDGNASSLLEQVRSFVPWMAREAGAKTELEELRAWKAEAKQLFRDVYDTVKAQEATLALCHLTSGLTKEHYTKMRNMMEEEK